MAPDPTCSALNAAIKSKGVTYGQIASQLGISEQHIIDICTGTAKPSRAEFDSLARALDIKSQIPMSPAHQTTF